jgi:hypothetical protein
MQNQTTTSPLPYATSYKEGIILNWQTLQVEPSDSFSCEACGLPGWACSRAYRVPGVVGRFHNIRCVECVLCGPRRCRWCGEKLGDRAGRRFCSEACARHSNVARFGNGQRLLNYLRRHYPNPYQQVAGSALLAVGTQAKSAAGICLRCRGPLNGKRADALFCSARCKTRYHRSLARTQNRPISRNSGTTESTTYNDPKCGMGLHHYRLGQNGSGR